MPRDFFSEDTEPAEPPLPLWLKALGPRQREIAEIVYASTAATPVEVQARLSDRRSVRVVRTLLDRMVAKGVLRRRRSGRRNEVIYVAAIVTQSVRNTALKRLINERFDGSAANAAALVASMAKRVRPTPCTPTAARRLAGYWGGTSSSFEVAR